MNVSIEIKKWEELKNSDLPAEILLAFEKYLKEIYSWSRNNNTDKTAVEKLLKDIVIYDIKTKHKFSQDMVVENHVDLWGSSDGKYNGAWKRHGW